MRILVLADTHVPDRASRLPPALFPLLADCDGVIHAGDFTHPSVPDELAARSELFCGVCGNMDAKLAARFPPSRVETLSGVRVGVVHRLQDADFSDVDVLIHGHTHIARVESRNGVIYLCPGSPTDPRQGVPSCAVLTLEGGKPAPELLPLL